MLATTLNVEFDPDRSWDEKKQIYRLVEQDRPHRKCHSVGGRRQARPLDHRDRIRGSDLRLIFEGNTAATVRATCDSRFSLGVLWLRALRRLLSDTFASRRKAVRHHRTSYFLNTSW